GELGTVSNANSTVYSTCQSNDSNGEQGIISENSANDDSIPIPSSEQVSISTQKTQPQVPKPQNWNQRMERELGAGYSFERKPCFVCGSFSHLIKDCDYYEKKMAREAALKSKRVIHVDARQATPAWTNTNRVNKANQFTPRPVQLSNIRPNLSTASNTIKTGRVNVNTGHGNVNSDSTSIKPDFKQQKKRKAQVQFEAQHYTNEDWDLIRAKLEANVEVSKSMLGSELQGEDFAKRMVDLVNQRKKFFAEERAKANIDEELPLIPCTLPLFDIIR
ncbi:hypothetical protein Tco_1580671, partial [Tanacetum coccineum]